MSVAKFEIFRGQSWSPAWRILGGGRSSKATPKSAHFCQKPRQKTTIFKPRRGANFFIIWYLRIRYLHLIELGPADFLDVVRGSGGVLVAEIC